MPRTVAIRLKFVADYSVARRGMTSAASNQTTLEEMVRSGYSAKPWSSGE